MRRKHLIRQPTSGCHLPPLGKADCGDISAEALAKAVEAEGYKVI